MKEVYCNIKEGKITNPVTIRKAFELPDGLYRLTLQSCRKRTSKQNRWLHGILPDVVKGLQNLGYREVKTNAHAKAVLKAIFFKKTITNGIEEIEIIEPTSETDRGEFAGKEEEIIVWAKDYLGINIAPPGSQSEIWDVSMQAQYDSETNTTIVNK